MVPSFDRLVDSLQFEPFHSYPTALDIQQPSKMSAAQAVRAGANAASKAAGGGTLHKFAKRDPELYVCS